MFNDVRYYRAIAKYVGNLDYRRASSIEKAEVLIRACWQLLTMTPILFFDDPDCMQLARKRLRQFERRKSKVEKFIAQHYDGKTRYFDTSRLS